MFISKVQLVNSLRLSICIFLTSNFNYKKSSFSFYKKMYLEKLTFFPMSYNSTIGLEKSPCFYIFMTELNVYSYYLPH